MAKRSTSRRRSDRVVSDSSPLVQYHLLLFQDGESMIDRGLLFEVQQKLDECISSTPAETAIDLWLESGGGDAHAAFKLYHELRSRCSWLRVIVPDYAKSAATLVAIGADELYLAAAADLGPLDAQIPHPDREGERVSSLAGANALEHLATLGVDLSLSEGPWLIQTTKLPRAEVLRELLQYAANILEPVLSKLDPQLIHEAAEQLKVMRQYAEIVLRQRKNEDISPNDAKRIARELVTAFPTHGYVIERKQVAKLGIPHKALDDHPLWPRMQSLWERFIESRENLLLHVLSDVEVSASDDP